VESRNPQDEIVLVLDLDALLLLEESYRGAK
jgi:hypothetical protein